MDMDAIVMTEVYAGFYELIGGRQYDLEDVLHRIDVMYAAGRLTDDERTALYALARENAKAEYDCSAEIESLWVAVRDIRDRLTALEGESSEEPQEPADEWPEFTQPTGAHDAYYTGDKITYNGKHYVCIMPENVACTYPPDVYPAGWQEVTD